MTMNNNTENNNNLMLATVPQSLTHASNNVPNFVLKLWKMCNNHDVSKILSWNEDGTTFIIHDQVAFITTLLPMYFKHNNMGSFVRQLNLYDFHKVCMDRHTILEYQHKFFQKGQPEMLKHIKRKLPRFKRVIYNSNGNSGNTKTCCCGGGQDSAVCRNNAKNREELADLTNQVIEMRTQQERSIAKIQSLEEENRLLMKEVNTLHRRCNSQTLMMRNIVELLIPFVKTYERNRQRAESTSAMRFLEVDPCILEKLEAIKRSELENTPKTENLVQQQRSSLEVYKPSSLQMVPPAMINGLNGYPTTPEMSPPSFEAVDPAFVAADPAFGGIPPPAQPTELPANVQIKLGSPQDNSTMSDEYFFTDFPVDSSDSVQPVVTSPTDTTGTTDTPPEFETNDQIMYEELPSDGEDTKSNLIFLDRELDSLIESGVLDGMLEDSN